MTPDIQDDLDRIEEAAGEGRPVHVQVTAEIEQGSCDAIQRVLTLLRRLKVPSADLALSSIGGTTTCGVELHNMLRSSPVRISAYNVGTVSSAAVDMFVGVAPERRYATPGGQFLLHATEYQPDDGETITIAKAKNIITSLEADDATTIALVTATTKITRRQLQTAFAAGRELVYAAQDARKAGLVRAVKPYVVPKDAEVILIQGAEEDED